MLRFFRKIREKLIQESSLRRPASPVVRYLLYAIGEIALVMIGILLALQVNNWNEERKEGEQEKRVIASLHNEFRENLKELDIDIKRAENVYQHTDSMMDLLLDPGEITEDQFNSILTEILKSPTWNPSSYVLNDLKNSGQISRLSDPDLQLVLFEWERNYENMLEINASVRVTSLELIKFMNQEGSLRDVDARITDDFVEVLPSRISSDNRKLLQNVTFENYIDDRHITAAQMRQEYKDARELILKILKITEGE